MQGVTGASGPLGPTGATGLQGIQGLQGPSGPSGSQGAQGATGTQGATGAQGTAGVDAPKQIAGFVNGDGSIRHGLDFTVVKNSTGNYTINFPVGTWNDVYAVNTDGFGAGTSDGTVTYLVAGSNGIGVFTVDFGGVDTSFMFTATEVNDGGF